MIAFAFGQLGLGLTAVFGICIADLTNQHRYRPPWYVTILVWLVAVASVFALCDPLVFPRLDYLPLASYCFRFAVGCSACGIYILLRYRRGRPLSKTMVRRLNNVIAVGCLLLLLAVGGMKFFGPQIDESRFHVLQSEVRSNRSMMRKDTLLTARLKAVIDSQSQQLDAYKQQIDLLSRQLLHANQKLEQVTDLLATLNRHIKKIDRQQTTIHADIGDIKQQQGPQPLQPQPPKQFMLPPDKVSVPPPFKHRN